MKTFNDIVVTQIKRKINGKFKWIVTYELDNVILNQSIHTMKQNNLQQLAFNICVNDVNLQYLCHTSSF
jgi:hypothetical protein